ncbi:MAG: Crp/Fnr family transcriptional regulator [Pseudomonadales bacterium]|nr:Crp/Fnr family transcriptional regulator [Pseudomonadales bacterium]
MDISTLNKIVPNQSCIRLKPYQAGEVIFSQGDFARNIFAIHSGQVSLTRPTIEGRLVTLYRAKAGDSFAEAALFSTHYHCNATATRDSQLYLYPKKQLTDTLNRQSALSISLLKGLCGQIRDLRSQLAMRNILSARARVLQYLSTKANTETGNMLPLIPPAGT